MENKFNIYAKGKLFQRRKIIRDFENIVKNEYTLFHLNGKETTKLFGVKMALVTLETKPSSLKKPLTIIGDQNEINRALEMLQEACNNQYFNGGSAGLELTVGNRYLF